MFTPIVLDVKIFQAQTPGQAVGFHQRREAGAHIDRVAGDRQELAIAPDRRRTGLDRSPTHPGANGVVVVDDLKGAKADVFTDVARRGLVGVSAFLAAQARERGAGKGGCHGLAATTKKTSSALLVSR